MARMDRWSLGARTALAGGASRGWYRPEGPRAPLENTSTYRSMPLEWPLPPLPGVPEALERLVPGETVETGHGPFFLRRTMYGLDDYHGQWRIGDALGLSAQAAALLARTPELAGLPLESMIFLDTETTGLAGGTGTYVILVGIGYFEAASGPFVVEQCFMRGYGEERAMLTWLAARLARFEAMATFNGRTFDVPLLGTRFRLSRLRASLEDVPHFDLLHASRRLWRAAVPSCSLQSLEQHILGIQREDDLAGHLIPAVYQHYLRHGDGRYVQRVFQHNLVDVLSMVALAVRACQAAEPHAHDGGESRGWVLAGAELLGLARLLGQSGDVDGAERAYRRALAGTLPQDRRRQALLDLAGLLRRAGRYEAAAGCWHSLATEPHLSGVLALVELAKYWEHQRRVPEEARRFAGLARDRWAAVYGHAPQGPGRPRMWVAAPVATPPDDFERRIARLDAKLTRAASG